MSTDWAAGKVSNVERCTQAEELGVKVGWRLLQIDSNPYSEDLMKRYRAATKPFEVVFLAPCSYISKVTYRDFAMPARSKQIERNSNILNLNIFGSLIFKIKN